MTSVAAIAVRDPPQLEDRLAAAVHFAHRLGHRRRRLEVERLVGARDRPAAGRRLHARRAHAWLVPKRPSRTLLMTTRTSMMPMKVT